MIQLSFKLDDTFIENYATINPPWGFGMLSELTFIRTYSRLKQDGTKERWYETIRRVVEGCYSIQKDHCTTYNLPWDDEKAQASAREMYDRMFNFKIWAPGRGLEYMGTKVVNEDKDSSWLYNCAFISTTTLEDNPSKPFAKAMHMLMHGIGVGFDTRGAGKVHVVRPDQNDYTYVVPDSTEGWVESTRRLLASYLSGERKVYFDYSKIRPAGSPIKTSGGIAPGPGPLKALHKKLRTLYEGGLGYPVSSRLIVDTFNLIGKSVASGGRRRSAELALGDFKDEDFINLKDYTLPENKERTGDEGWAWSSNNSIIKNGDLDYTWFAERQLRNGEPGLFDEHLVKNYGRLADGPLPVPDSAIGTNPCSEISLEDGEVCNLCTVNMTRHDSDEDFYRSIKFAYLFSKSVTLLPTKWPETNGVQLRNRRIGLSVSSIAQYIDSEEGSWTALRKRLDRGYAEVRAWDDLYSEWLGVRQSIKVTTVKPEGSAALLAGSSPGVHFPVASTYIRRMRLNINDPNVNILHAAGYDIQPAYGDETSTVVVSIPVHDRTDVRSQDNVSVYEKMALAVLLQEVWSDNQVSCTLSFRRDEVTDLARVLEIYEGKYKSISCLAIDQGTYQQMPYESIDEDTYNSMNNMLSTVDFDSIYDGNNNVDADGDKYCSTDVCEI